jgi:hypothetical protein
LLRVGFYNCHCCLELSATTVDTQGSGALLRRAAWVYISNHLWLTEVSV